MKPVAATAVPHELREEVRALFDAPIRVEEAVERLREMHPDTPTLVAAAINAAANGLQGTYRSTVRAARAARWLAREVACEHSLARSWSVLGQALLGMGRSASSLGPLQRAQTGFRVRGDERWFFGTGLRMVHPLMQLGRTREAIRHADLALSYFEQHGPAYEYADALFNRGLIEQRRERYRDALETYRQAARYLSRTDPDAPLRTALPANYSVALEGCQRYRAAEHWLEGLEERMRGDRGNPVWAAVVRGNRAHLEAVQGRLRAALDGFRQAEVELAELHVPRIEAQFSLERAEVLLLLSMSDAARRLAATAAIVFREHGLDKETGQAHQLMASADLVEGRVDRALRSLEVARRWFVGAGLDARVGDVDLLAATAEERRGRLDAAQVLASRAQDTFLRVGDAERAARADILVGRLDVRHGLPARALDRADVAWNRLRRVPAPDTRVQIEKLRAAAHREQGDEDAWLASLRRAISALESQRGLLPPGEFMVSFLASKATLYSEVVAALCDAGWPREAFDYAERAKSRALVDLLAGRSTPRRGRARRASLRGDRIRRLRERLNAAYSRLHRGTSDVDARDVRDLEIRLSALLRDAWLDDPELASTTSVGTVPLSEIQACLGPDTALVEYFVTDDRTYVFVADDTDLNVVPIDVPAADIVRMVRLFRFHLTRHHVPDDHPRPSDDLVLAATRANLAALHAVLVDPIEHLLDAARLVIAPHGPLHGFPFHALPDGDGWLGDRHEIWYVPSASVLAYCAAERRTATGPSTILALPDEWAPAIAEDVHAVAQALGDDAQCLLSEAADSEALRRAARSSRVLHLATHGMYRVDRPALSSVRLHDGWLHAADVFDLDIRSELVTLAACESGVAAVTDGDEVLGLLRGFLFAGAPRLLASQWRIDDRVTAEFMRAFYAAAREGGSWGSALRAAMCAVRERHPHPFFWAPFFLVGHPGPAPDEAPANAPATGAKGTTRHDPMRDL